MNTLRTILSAKMKRSFNIRRILETQSRFKIAVVLFFMIIFETMLFFLFYDGFKFLHNLGGAGIFIVQHLFALFFLAIGTMLAVSGIVSSYATIFRSDEVHFLMVQPVALSDIIVYKFFESTLISSWAFLFIVIPFICAYAQYQFMPLIFVLWTALFSIPFLAICSGLGTLVTLISVRWGPSGRALKIVISIILIFLLLAGIMEIRRLSNMKAVEHFNLAELIPGITLASNKLLPSWWVAQGISSLTNHEWIRGVMLMCLTVSTAMVMFMAVRRTGVMVFYTSFQRVVSGTTQTSRPIVTNTILRSMLWMFPRDSRAMIIKDVKSFLRDPVQWSQALIFFGLLALVFSNLRALRYDTWPEVWRNTFAFLNTFSVSAIICSLGSRFVYPQLSLEGHSFWILGLSPVKLSRIVITKFFTSFIPLMIISVLLMILSAKMLDASRISLMVSVAHAIAVSSAVCGLSTGLGAIFMNLEEQNPSAIVSGFGGTLNLVMSLCFMLLAILPFAFIFHAHSAFRIPLIKLKPTLMLSSLWLAAVTLIATATPLWMGWKSLSKREF